MPSEEPLGRTMVSFASWTPSPSVSSTQMSSPGRPVSGLNASHEATRGGTVSVAL